MKKQIFNPILPLGEYVPDGEPHVFDGRVYLMVEYIYMVPMIKKVEIHSACKIM